MTDQPSEGVDLREQVAWFVAAAVNMALAGVKAPGRLETDSEGATYYADAISANHGEPTLWQPLPPAPVSSGIAGEGGEDE